MCFRVVWKSPTYTFVTTWDQHYTPAFREEMLERKAKELTADYGETFVVGGHSVWGEDIATTLYRNGDGIPVCMNPDCEHRYMAIARCFVCGEAFCDPCLNVLNKESRERIGLHEDDIGAVCGECFAS